MKRPSRKAVLALLGVSLLVPALLLSLLGVKLLRDFRGVSQTVRAEYGEYIGALAAASVEGSLWEQEQLNMVAARLAPPRTPEEVVRFLDRFQADNPLYLMAFFVIPEGLVHYSQFNAPRTAEYRPLPSWIAFPVLDLLEQTGLPSGLHHVAAPDSLNPAQVTFFTLHSPEGDLLGAAGFLWDLEYLRRERSFLARAVNFEQGESARVFRGAFFETPTRVTLLDERGEPFFSTGQAPEETYIAKLPFDRLLPFYTVGVQLGDDSLNTRVQRVIWTHLASITAMFLVIVIAVAFALRFLVHEMELSEMKSSLVSNVSHELKTPLSLIRLFSETLEMGRAGGPDKEKEFLRIIHRESDRLTHLIDNLLDLGRIEEGRKTYNLQPVDLAGVVGDTLEAYRYQLEEQGFSVETDVQTDLPKVEADPEAITQALLNLMDNAIKYSVKEKQIRVALAREDGHAVLSVEDRGIGISAADQAKIFDKFYRVEKGLVHTVKGSGLGLALVQHIAAAHGGSVRVASRPGRGSRFSIAIPLAGERSENGRDNG